MKNQKNQTRVEMSNTNYKRMGKNIYKVGNRYRVRVGEYSSYHLTLKGARACREVHLIGATSWKY